jgi:uncharacterized protein DUF3365
MTRVLALLLAAGILSAAAPQDKSADLRWPTYSISQAPAELRPQIQRADLIIVGLQNAMLAELSRELSQGGSATAIRACHLDTTAAAYRIARQEGIQAGRTSDRLRVPTNAPKPWAAPIVAMNAGKRAADVEGFAVDLGRAVGVLRPIVEGPTCAACHGDIEKLNPQVRGELADRYPQDRAVNFKAGELRGWFWVEIPKQ